MADKSSSPLVPLLVLVLVFAGAVLLGRYRTAPQVALPEPLPQVQVNGWLNTDVNLTADDLAGKWVVVDFWATWCDPCLAAMPELAALRDRWQAKNVQVLGITSDGQADLVKVQQATDNIPGFTWPVAYGGQQAFTALDVEAIPLLVLYSPSGQQVWRGHRVSELEAELTARVGE